MQNNIHTVSDKVRYMMYGVHPIIKNNKNKSLKSNKKKKNKGQIVDLYV